MPSLKGVTTTGNIILDNYLLMKKRIFTWLIAVGVISMSPLKTLAMDYCSVDPLWEFAVIHGSERVLSQINTQTYKTLETAALQNTIALHFNAVKEWQRKYNGYLKNAESYAEAFNAGTRLTSEAIRTIRDLMDLKKVMSRNPEGIAATLSMNNLYAETITEFIKTFRMLKFSVSTGGELNMLTGKERTEMLWALVDRMDELNTKVRKLILSVAYYRVKDIWSFYTRGMFERHKADIAENCLERWNRIHDAVRIMN